MARRRNKKKSKSKKSKKTSENLGYRSCGACAECCVTLHISALNKPKHTSCTHMCMGDKVGCEIYSQRPTECMTFQCLWTQRDLPNNAKPSKTGVMAYYVESQFGPTVFITETRSGAFDQSERVKNIALDLAAKKKMAAIVCTYEGQATAMVP